MSSLIWELPRHPYTWLALASSISLAKEPLLLHMSLDDFVIQTKNTEMKISHSLHMVIGQARNSSHQPWIESTQYTNIAS